MRIAAIEQMEKISRFRCFIDRRRLGLRWVIEMPTYGGRRLSPSPRPRRLLYRPRFAGALRHGYAVDRWLARHTQFYTPSPYAYRDIFPHCFEFGPTLSMRFAMRRAADRKIITY